MIVNNNNEIKLIYIDNNSAIEQILVNYIIKCMKCSYETVLLDYSKIRGTVFKMTTRLLIFV